MRCPASFERLAALLILIWLGGCAHPAYDYSSFKESRPASILVLPPLNSSPDVAATYSLLSEATFPLAESGYYVLPVALVDETFRQNGLDSPADIHQLPVEKLRQIFGADAALYIEVKEYGTRYVVVASDTRVTAAARLVDLRSGKTLWAGAATASSNENNNSSGLGLAGLLIKAIVEQVVSNLADKAHAVAGVTANRLLAAGRPNGILYGPRSPLYLKDGSPTP